MYKFAYSIFLLLLSLQTHAGAWGVGAFENDTALDWLSDVSNSENSLTLLKTTIDAPTRGAFIDADICSSAIAAAEIVAIIFNSSTEKHSKEILNLATSLKPELSREAIPKAEKAVAICSSELESELKQLWGDSKEWNRYINGLQLRLKSALNK